MSKTKLFVDCDGVIIDSISSICNTYNTLYKYNSNFKPAIPENTKTWSMKEVIPLCDSVEELFDSHLFFEYVQFMHNAKEVLLELSERYNIHIISIGTLLNVSQKAIWIKENLPFIKNVILISKDGGKMGKDKIVMDGGIVLDDHQENLTNPTCSLPIAFGKVFEWNSSFQGVRCSNWEAVRELLLD